MKVIRISSLPSSSLCGIVVIAVFDRGRRQVVGRHGYAGARRRPVGIVLARHGLLPLGCLRRSQTAGHDRDGGQAHSLNHFTTVKGESLRLIFWFHAGLLLLAAIVVAGLRTIDETVRLFSLIIFVKPIISAAGRICCIEPASSYCSRVIQVPLDIHPFFV